MLDVYSKTYELPMIAVLHRAHNNFYLLKFFT